MGSHYKILKLKALFRNLDKKFRGSDRDMIRRQNCRLRYVTATMGNQPTNKYPLSNIKQKIIAIANKLVLSILFSPVSTTVNNHCCFIDAEQHY